MSGITTLHFEPTAQDVIRGVLRHIDLLMAVLCLVGLLTSRTWTKDDDMTTDTAEPPAIDYEARVAKGIALLDEKYPEWLRAIDLGRLSIRSGFDCVTAQLAQHQDSNLARNWMDGMNLLGLADDLYNTGTYTQHGFMVEHERAPGMPEDYDTYATAAKLTGIWKREIEALRATTPPTDA